MQLGVVVALPLEARCLLGHGTKPGARVMLHQASPDSVVWVHVSGMGPQNARRAAESLLASGATALMSWGLAAGLAPELRRGNLVLPETVLTANGRSITVDASWHRQITDALNGLINTTKGSLAETMSALTTPDAKASLLKDSNAVAADMESAAIGEVAQRAGVPFLVIRAVVDDSATRLPPAAIAAMDMNGKFQISNWLKSVLRHPSQLSDMLPLALGLRAACSTLARTATLIKPHLQPQTKPIT